MTKRNVRRAEAALIALGVLAGACGTGAPPHLAVTALPAQPAPAARPADRTPSSAEPGATLLARYELANGGGRPLVLHGLVLDCGCTLVSALPDALAPGERATIALRCRAPSAGGAATRTSRLVTNDPAAPEAPLGVAFAAAAPAAAEPAALYFGYVPVGGAAIRDLATTTAPSAHDPALTVEARSPGADGRTTYRVRFAPTVAGPFRGALSAGARTVPVSGVGYARVLAFPAEVELPNPATSGAPPVITLTNVGAEPLAIARVELPPGLVGEVVPAGAGREFRLALRVRAPLPAGGGVIRIYTSDAAAPVLEIPVRAAEAT
jgi:hypothetical protein